MCECLHLSFPFSQYLEALRRGLNTNPDILCNQRIKFGALFEYLSGRSLGVDRVATGHYARTRHMEDGEKLKPGKSMLPQK